MSSKADTPSTPRGEDHPARAPLPAVPPARIPQVGEGTFQKGRVVWGRPPAVTFRAGPLPRDEGLARLLAMPPHPQPKKPTVTGSTAISPAKVAPTATGVGGFSNVPQKSARPAASGGIFGNSLVPPPAKPQPTVQPPVQPEPAPAQQPELVPPAAPQVVEPRVETATVHELEPVVAVRPASPAVAAPVSEPAAPARSSRGVWVAVGALVLVAGAAGLWWMSRDAAPEPVPVTRQPEAPAALAEPVAAEADVSEEPQAPEAAAPEPVRTQPQASAQTPVQAQVQPQARAEPAPRQPVREAPATQREQAAQREPAAPPVVVVTPSEVTAPPVVEGPPPTTARPVPTDPDAPVVTRPTPLDGGT